MDSEHVYKQFLGELFSSLLDEVLARVRVIVDEIFEKEFVFEADQRERFRQSVRRVEQIAYRHFGILFNGLELEGESLNCVTAVVTTFDAWRHDICEVLESAQIGCEIGTVFAAEFRRIQDHVGAMSNAAIGARDNIVRLLPSTAFRSVTDQEDPNANL